MVKIYTRKGDDGTTGLYFGGGRVAKDSAAISVNGDVDEAQAMLGLARAEAEPGSELDVLLLELERDLWVLMAEVATAPENRPKLVAGATLVTDDMVGGLEGRIDTLNERFEMPKEFVVPGQNRVSAALDVARTVVRRAERGFTGAALAPGSGSLVGPYLNRLSDLLWTMARWQEGVHIGSRSLGPAPGAADSGAGASGAGAGAGVSPDVALTRSALLEVACADIEDPGAVSDAARVPVAVVGVPVVDTGDGPTVADGVPATVVVSGGGTALATALDAARARQRGFTGKAGQTMAVVGESGAQGSLGAEAPAVVFVGLGKVESGRIAGADALRRAGAALVRAGGKSGAAVLVLSAPVADGVGSRRGAVQAVVEGAVLGAYRFVSHKSDRDGGGIERFVVAGAGLDAAELTEGTRRGVAVADAVALARDLVNEPPSSLTPTRFAEAAVAHAEGRAGVSVEVWDEQRITDERLGGLLGVARGSAEPPRLLKVSYQPADPVTVEGKVPHVVLVGKGITFDSGGLSLKTPDGMITMKTDMSGAAVVLAAVSACADVGVRVRVTAITPTTENMPGGRATKPGDVLTIRNGRTIEVLNTDAEGRLVLADGLSLAAELEPDAIIDLATLTGACVVALGMAIAGVFGTDDVLIGRVRAASARAGEGTWQLPLPDEYRSHIDSEVADMKNVGKGGQAGAIAAALLLAEFVEKVPWVHLDIAGPARSDEDSGILTKGGTGFGVRTLLELLEEYGSES